MYDKKGLRAEVARLQNLVDESLRDVADVQAELKKEQDSLKMLQPIGGRTLLYSKDPHIAYEKENPNFRFATPDLPDIPSIKEADIWSRE